jgi:hypothetical protein
MPRKSKLTDYEPCPAGCGKRRWKGLDGPLCDHCTVHIVDVEWIEFRSRLRRDSAPISVMAPFDQAMIEDCKETLYQLKQAQKRNQGATASSRP